MDPQTALCPNAPDPLRGYYCDTVATDLTTLSQRIGTLKAPAKPNSFTRADFATAQSSIGLEIQDVANIRGAIAAYQTLFGTATTTGAVDAAQIALTIQAQLFSAAATTNVKTSGAWGAMVDLAEADPELSSVAALLAGAWALQKRHCVGQLGRPRPTERRRGQPSDDRGRADAGLQHGVRRAQH